MASSLPDHDPRTVARLDRVATSTSARWVVDAILARDPVSRNVDAELRDRRTFGERLSDRIAEIGGSWGFILAFVATLAAWIVVNSLLLASRRVAFDPYPYILLDLVPSPPMSIR